MKLHRAIEDEEDHGPEVISFFSTMIATEIVFIVDFSLAVSTCPRCKQNLSALKN